MLHTGEGWHTVGDGTKLYTKTWLPEQCPPKAILAVVHGFSDHCNAYYDFFPSLAERGIEVRGYDQRGWGRSISPPNPTKESWVLGCSGPTSLVLSDLRSFLSSLPTNAPLFLFGHSMGGAIVLYNSLLTSLAARFTAPLPRLRGLIASSPYIALHPSSQPYRLTVRLGRLAARLLPYFPLQRGLDPAFMCRDPEIGAAWRADPLCHDTGTLEQLDGMLRRAEALDRIGKGERVKGVGDVVKDINGERAEADGGDGTSREGEVAFLMLHGTGDGVTSAEASQRLFERLWNMDKTLKVYDGAYHKLHVETEGVKEEYLDDVSKWILERAAAGGGMERAAVDERNVAGQKSKDQAGKGFREEELGRPKL